MMKTVEMLFDYDAPPEMLWALMTDFESLKEVMEGVVRFDGLPEGRIYEGQRIEVMVSLFGKLPAQPYVMEIREFSDEEMYFVSSEKGAGVKQWLHTSRVTGTARGSRITDRIEIDAGWLTPVFAMWAKYLYRARHKPRVRMLAERMAAR